MALKKGTWSPEEDKKLTDYIKIYGIGNWSKMPEPAGLSRTGKSCRLRWVNYLSPTVKRGKFTCQEDGIITRMHQVLGNKWSTIAAALPGRSDNEIKNHWHTHLRKRPRKLVQKKPQVTSAVSDDNILNPSKLNSSLTENNYVEPPVLLFPYVLDSSAEATSCSTSLEASVSQQNAEGSSDFPSYFREDSYTEYNQEVLFGESFGPTFSEFWDPEPMSSFGFYDSSYEMYDHSSNISVKDGDDGVFIEPLFQF